MEEQDKFDFSEVFDVEEYMYFYGSGKKGAPLQVDAVIQLLDLKETDIRILDMPCGYGRHANIFAERGFHVTGIDNSEGFLKIAREDKRSDNVDYICQDMREIDYDSEFDMVMMLSGSFGYFSDEDNEKVIQGIAKALKPGGMFIMDNLSRDHLLKKFNAQVVCRVNDDFMIDNNSFDFMSGRHKCKRTIIRDGKLKEYDFFLRLYNINELRALGEKYGLTLKQAYGDWQGNPYGISSKRQIVLFEKRSRLKARS